MNKIVLNRCYGGFSLSEKAGRWLKSHNYDFTHLQRHDPLLVRCVEELGEEASDDCSQLEIVEITSNMYRIEEYDGKEIVIEPSNSEWCKI